MHLKRGDTVVIVAPAAQMRGADRDLLEAACRLLQSWELSVKLRVDPRHHFYLAGPDDSRAAHLNTALNDPDIRAIFCMRGGFGSSRLWPHLGPTVRPSDKLIVGYSDATTLHLAAHRRWSDVGLIHGPNVATHQLLGPEPGHAINRRSLRSALFDPSHEIIEPVEFLRDGNATGTLIGGCLSVIAAGLGTPYALDTAGSILFLEDAGEAPYRVDRMLTQLQHAGAFDNIRGLVFGRMVNCVDPYNDIKLVIADIFCSAKFPVAFGLPSGHGDINLSLRLKHVASLDHRRGEFRLGPS